MNLKDLKDVYPLSEEDKNLFHEMKDKYRSEAEKKFFTELKWKEEHETAFANECLIYEGDNDCLVLKKVD